LETPNLCSLRDGRGLGVSLRVYAISDLDQKIETVTKLESAVIDASEEDAFEFVASGKRNPESRLGKGYGVTARTADLLCC
jgi:hypothetical protein